MTIQSSRRTFLQAGFLSCCGLTLSDLLRAEDALGSPDRRRAIINVHLDGGPPQMDTIDPKPDAPSEIRGEFQPIATQLPGFSVTELLPRVAASANDFAFIRSLVGSAGRHDAFQCQSGFGSKDLEALGGRPAMGCIVSRLCGSAEDPAPAFIDLMQGRPLVRNSARPGFLGPAFQPFRPDVSHLFERELEAGMKNELAALGGDHTTQLELNETLNIQRLGDRVQLARSLDRIRRQVDRSGMMDAMDRFSQQAIGILTSGRLAQALDLEQEDPRVLAKYTPPVRKDLYQFYTSEGPDSIKKFLLARRLIEAGVRVVSISVSDFDTHSKNFPRMRQLMPLVDHGLSTLVQDLKQRGMIDDVTIIAWGEFGRTPKVNDKGGRDHWPRVSPAILAGGSLQTGQVLGRTDRTASAATQQAVHYQDVFATLYHTLGIDARRTTVVDPRGRPQYLLDQGQVIRELV